MLAGNCASCAKLDWLHFYETLLDWLSIGISFGYHIGKYGQSTLSPGQYLLRYCTGTPLADIATDFEYLTWMANLLPLLLRWLL
jgi:hypothetical protein